MNDFTADVVVIGGGIAGTSIALRLSEKGRKVILLEKGRVGEEASGRNGGGVRQQDRHPDGTAPCHGSDQALGGHAGRTRM